MFILSALPCLPTVGKQETSKFNVERTAENPEYERNEGRKGHKLLSIIPKCKLCISVNTQRNWCLFCNKPHYFMPFRSATLAINTSHQLNPLYSIVLYMKDKNLARNVIYDNSEMSTMPLKQTQNVILELNVLIILFDIKPRLIS